MEGMRTAVAEVLARNTRTEGSHRYTVPSPELYPFQWLWDSCFHAFIYNALGDDEAAKAELGAAAARPLRGGLLPHIIYWKPLPPEMRWGREQRSDVIDAHWGVSGTSSITQPSLIARAVLETYQKSGDRAWLAAIFPVLHSYFAALAHERTYGDTELLITVNPDESGEDNSPRYDALLGLPVHHTPDVHLDARLRLMEQYRQCAFDTKTCMQRYFAVVDVGFNAIYLDGLEAMAELASVVAEDERSGYLARHERLTTDFALLRDSASGRYLSLDVLRGQSIPVTTWNVFMPLFCGLATDEDARALVALLHDPAAFAGAYGIRSTAASEASYDPLDGFWRGPIWPAVHWFVFRGLTRYSYSSETAHVREQLTKLIEMSGFREHYHPESGEGLGAHDFTWGGLLLDMGH